MERDDVIRVLSVLKVAYPSFYKEMTKKEAEETISLYMDMFSADDSQVVLYAVKELVNTLKFPPTIADIKGKILELTRVKEDLTEAWDKVQKAIGCGLYNSEEGFETLSPIGKKFVRTPSQLREMAMMDSDIVHSVVKGQFFKQAEILQKRADEEKQMLPETKKIRAMITGIGQDVNEVLKIGE